MKLHPGQVLVWKKALIEGAAGAQAGPVTPAGPASCHRVADRPQRRRGLRVI